MIQHLNHPQCQLEGAIGMVRKAALLHGDTPKAVRLWKLAIELSSLRDPEVIAFYDSRRLRAAQGQAEAANG